jgi:hypothetical protein
MIGNVLLWCGAGLNRRHKDFQSFSATADTAPDASKKFTT